jgi:hypothetical protein
MEALLAQRLQTTRRRNPACLGIARDMPAADPCRCTQKAWQPFKSIRISEKWRFGLSWHGR